MGRGFRSNMYPEWSDAMMIGVVDDPWASRVCISFCHADLKTILHVQALSRLVSSW